jgi:hypothetical protein
MELTAEQQEIAGNAYLLSLEGKGQVLEPHAYPAAQELAEAGWLERRFEPDGDMSWWWTPAAETALELGDLTNRPSPN